MSLRFGCAVLVAALVPAALLAMVWEPLMYSAFLFLPVVLITGLLFGSPLYCPACRKRIKAGASLCAHCGSPIPQ